MLYTVILILGVFYRQYNYKANGFQVGLNFDLGYILQPLNFEQILKYVLSITP